jgi:hypothetical protein
MLNFIKTAIKNKKSASHIIMTCNNTEVVKICIGDLSKDTFVNWSKNRPPDKVRIQAISQYYSTNNIQLVPGIIYAWKHPERDYIEIYDGIHRLLASYEQTYPMTCIMSIYTTIDEQNIIDDFLNINKSVSVPSIYLDDTNVFKKLICENVAHLFCKSYPQFVSSSRRPCIYNFNRDNFIEYISTFNIDFCKPNIDKQIFNELVGLNHQAHEFIKRNNINCPKKCHTYKFFLFYLDKNFIKTHIEQTI